MSALVSRGFLLDAGRVDDQHEVHALQAVRDRLRRRYADVDPEVVEAAVQQALAELTGPIRDFAPLLVERVATERLGPSGRTPSEAPAGRTRTPAPF